MGAIRLFLFRRIRHQPLRAALAAVTIAAGVSLAVAVSVIDSSIRTSIEEFEETLAGVAPLRVVGITRQGGIDESTVERIGAVDGVATAVPMVQAVTLADDGKGNVLPALAIGVDCRAMALFGQSLPCTDQLLAGAGDRPVAVGNGLFRDLGPSPNLRTNTGSVSLRNAPGFGLTGLDQISSERVVLFTLEGAQRQFSRSDAVDVVYVQPADGTDVGAVQRAVEEAAGARHSVLQAGDIPAELEVAITGFVAIIGLVSLVSLGTGGVLVHNTVRLSMEERRRQLAIIAAVGGGPRVVAGGALVEAGLLGLIGGVLGSGAGTLVARPMMNTLSQLTENLAGVSLDVHPQLTTLFIGAALGLATGLAAAVISAWRALQLDVVGELTLRDDRGSKTPRARWLLTGLSVVLVGAGLIGCIVGSRRGGIERWQAAMMPASLLVATVGLLLGAASAATLSPTLIRWARPFTRRLDAATQLALTNLVREPRRTIATAAAVTAAVGMAFTTANFNRAAHEGITETIVSNLPGVSVSAVDPTYYQVLDARIPAAAIDRIEGLPEVDRIERGAQRVVGSTIDDLVLVQAWERPWFDAEVFVGSNDRARFDAGEIMIGPVLAREWDLRPGDEISLPTDGGIVDVPIQGVWQDGNLAGRAVTIPYPLYERLYGVEAPAALSVIPKPGVSIEQLAGAVQGSEPDLYVSTPAELAREVGQEVDKQFEPMEIMERWLYLVAFVAVLSTLLMIGVQRQREMGLLAAVGMKPSEMGRMVMAEGVIVGVGGILGGAAFGVVGYYAMALALAVQTGIYSEYRLDGAALIVSGLLAIGLCLAASAWPAWRAARLQVVEALQYE